MAEVLFIATTIFVAYVVYEAIGKKTGKPETKQPEVKQVGSEDSATIVEKIIIPPPPSETAKPVAKAAASKPSKATTSKSAKTAPAKPSKASAKKTAASASTMADSLKNPKTGEIAKIPSNYAFAKRWIKEALVEEGLLDKIYKNNELDSTITAKIKTALEQLKAMEKYQ